MKLKFLFLFFFINIRTCFPQKKVDAFTSKGKSKQYNNTGSGKQTINNYNYYTINNTYNSKLSAKENAINSIRGFFKKSKEPVLEFPYLVLGSVSSQKNKHLISTGSDYTETVDVYTSKGQLQINAVIRDSKGDEIARISGNLWEISNTQNIEYNNDSTAFEIRSGKRVIFQLKIVKSTVFCNGMMCDEYGNCLYISPDKGMNYQLRTDAVQRFVLPEDFVLKPIFKYPRSEYLGVREN